MNTVGDAQKEAVHRSDWLSSSPPPKPAERAIAELQCHIPLGQWQPLYVHRAAGHITGRVLLPEGNLVELMLDIPLWLANNDRLVLHDISARMILADARVVTLGPPHRGKRESEYLQWLHALTAVDVDDTSTLELHLQRDTVRPKRFAWVRQLSEIGMAALIQRLDYLQARQRLPSASLAAY